MTAYIRRVDAALRHAPRTPDVKQVSLVDPDDAEDTMSSMAAEMSRALGADGFLIAWHIGEAEPIMLYADGACHPASAEERLMRESAIAAAKRGDAEGRWRTIDDDVSGVLATSIPAGLGQVTMTALFRQIGDTTRVRVRDTAARFLPLVRPFVRLWELRLRAVAQLRGLTAAVNKTDVGILLLDDFGRVTFANEAAEALLAEGDGIRRTNGMPGGAKLADTLRLQAAVDHVLSDGRATPRPTSPVVALTRRDRRPLLAAVVAGDAPGESAAIVYLFDPEQNLRPLLEPACKFYGLSPVETKLTCHLADGLSLAIAAERMRVREQTARSYLKQIFLKTDTNRQAELVWLMLKSSVRTAPGCRTSFV